MASWPADAMNKNRRLLIPYQIIHHNHKQQLTLSYHKQQLTSQRTAKQQHPTNQLPNSLQHFILVLDCVQIWLFNQIRKGIECEDSKIGEANEEEV